MALETVGSAEAFVIGGAAVYTLFLPDADRLYITWIDIEVPGDTLFPKVDWSAWDVVREADSIAELDAHFPHRFVDYVRNSN
jgi:dihydrofolate reductase